MTKSKNTKRTLLASVCSVILCVAMLIGSTFAWFTDTASTKVNKIQSGTLDVALEMQDAGGNWVDAEGKTLEWIKAKGAAEDEKVLWEPGCTYELPAVHIKNNGNLALKYKIVISGIVGDAGLLKVIDFTYGDLDVNAEGYLEAGMTSEAITIKGHMKEEAGNEYQNLSIEGIGITVVATQTPFESDSFGKDYDKELPLTQAATLEDLNKAIIGGGEVMLTSDVDAGMTKGSKIVITGSTTINGNGNTISTKDPDTNAYVSRVIDMDSQQDVTLNIVDVAITGGTTSGNNPYLYRGISLYSNTNPVLNIKSSTVTAGHYAINIASLNTNAKINVKNSTVTGYCAFQTHSAGTVATFDDSKIVGVNQWSGDDSDFSAVVVNSSANDSVLTFNNCAFEVSEWGTSAETFFSLRMGCTLALNNCTFVKNGQVVSVSEIIKDIENGTNQYVKHYNRSDVSIIINGSKVK